MFNQKNVLIAKSLVLAATVSGLVACAPPNKKLAPTPESPQLMKVSADLDTDFNNQVDVLFVIDNSASMEDEQKILADNIEGFITALKKTDFDYHIGIVTVGDAARIQPGSTNYYPTGRLRPLKNPGDAKVAIAHKATAKSQACTTTDVVAAAGAAAGAPSPLTGRAPGIVTRETDIAVLRESLKVGVQCLPDGGPEHEELLLPVKTALEMRSSENRGFYRDRAHLAVIIVSDATPTNDITSAALKTYLVKLKGEKAAQLLSLHAIGFNKGDVSAAMAQGRSAVCKPDYSRTETGEITTAGAGELEALTKGSRGRSNGQFLRMCSKGWGEKLVNIGADIRRRTLAKEIKLSGYPEKGSIQVKYGSQVIPAGPQGWSYHCESNTVRIADDVKLNDNEEKPVLTVEAMELTRSNLRRAGERCK